MRFKNRKPLAHRRNDDSLVLACGKKASGRPMTYVELRRP
jgi:hypothetical protein